MPLSTLQARRGDAADDAATADDDDHSLAKYAQNAVGRVFSTLRRPIST